MNEHSRKFTMKDFDLLVEDDVLYLATNKKVGSSHVNTYTLWKSLDGINWDEVVNMVTPVPDTWEESIWAGCITKRDDNYVAYYTGITEEDRVNSSKMGKATSSDLIHWKKEGHNPVMVLNAENPYYSEELQHAFRDPFSFEYKGKNYIVFCAKDKHQSPGKQGCVGIAEETVSGEYVWLPPIFSTGTYFDGLECPAIYYLQGRWYLLYGVDPENGEVAFRYAVADNPFGPFTVFSGNQLLPENYYNCRIAHFKGQYLLYAWYRYFEDGVKHQYLVGPKKIEFLDDGKITLLI